MCFDKIVDLAAWHKILFYVPFVEIGDYDENATEMGKPFCLTKDFIWYDNSLR